MNGRQERMCLGIYCGKSVLTDTGQHGCRLMYAISINLRVIVRSTMSC